MTKRTDIHRPSSPSFDPEAYELFGIFTIALKIRKVVGYVRAGSGDYMTPQYKTVDSPLKIALEDLKAKGWRTDDIGDRDSVIGNQCAHCGAHIRYGALLTYAKDLTLLVVGEDCLNNRFESDLTANEFHALREAGRLNRTRLTTAERVAAIYTANPKLVEARDSENGFVKDVIGKLEQNGELSERQIAAVIKAVQRDADWAVKKAADEKAMESAKDAPTGRVEVTGEVLSVKWRDSAFGGDFKMTVKTTDGWKLWVTRPRALSEVERGDTVSMMVTVTPSNDDPKFAFGKRPGQAKFIVSQKLIEQQRQQQVRRDAQRELANEYAREARLEAEMKGQ